eukprot:4928380-Amphidinium_carterae.3
MQSVWEIATPEYLTGEPDDVESIRFLGMEIETDRRTHDWIVHQQPYVMDTLNKFCPSLILRKRTTQSDAEGFMPKQKPKEPTTELIDDAALASILCSLLWLSLRTRPDISWAVSRLASLASTEPEETRRRLKQLMS